MLVCITRCEIAGSQKKQSQVHIGIRRKKSGLTRLRPHCDEGRVLHFGLETGDDIYAVSIGYRKSYGRFGTFAPLGPIM